MKKFALVCGILVSVVSLAMGAMSNEERFRAQEKCWERDKSACEALMNDSLYSVEQCDKDTCRFVGVVYVKAERYTEAIPYLEKAIALGDNKGYVGLGTAYYYGLQDYHNAKKYFEIACNKGNGDLGQALACSSLGEMYYDGKGVRQDYAKAAELWKKACDMEDANACFNLGVMYWTGEGVREDYAKAVEPYKKACDMEYANACFNLGALYYDGKGVRQDYAKAAELWKKACDMKDGGACNNLGVLYDKGQGVRQDKSIAKQYFGKACDLGEQMGCDNYKKLNQQGVR